MVIDRAIGEGDHMRNAPKQHQKFRFLHPLYMKNDKPGAWWDTFQKTCPFVVRE